MAKVGVVGPVHFLKVSHHGSHTGMPPEDIVAKLLPLPKPAAVRPQAAVSTYPKTYRGVPDEATTKELGKRVTLTSTRDLKPGKLFIEYKFSDKGPPA